MNFWESFDAWKKPLEHGFWWSKDYFEETIDHLDGLITNTKVIVIQVDEM